MGDTVLKANNSFFGATRGATAPGGVTQTGKLTVLLADDHWIARSAIAQLLPDLAETVTVIEASSSDEAIDLATKNASIDLMIIDLNMPGDRSPWETIAQLKEAAPTARLVMLSVSENREDVLRSLQEGAVGYVPKTSSPESILASLRQVLNGEVALPQRLLSDNAGAGSQDVMVDDVQVVSIAAAVEQFTPRQRELFARLGEGQDNHQMAEDLGLSVNTIRAHIQSIGSKLRVKSRSEITLCASRWKVRTEA